ncbi:MAG: DUF917 domain-containing protein [Deltaproteobacteria bacterium]|nr:DUF917 domain-containing protein [Deltaproteobacteria bacterium]
MPRRLSYQDMQDLITGAIVLGCGGGGDPAMAQAMVDEVFSNGKEFSLLDPKELRAEDWVCILGHVGGGVDPHEREMVKDLPRIWPHPILIAEEELAKYLQVEFRAYLPSEIGAGNTVTPLYVAALRGKSVIDGDAAGGRAKPELIISTTHLLGIPVPPIALANYYGDSLIVKNSSSDDRVEKICRYLSRVSGGRVAAARCPSQGKQILPAIYPYSISLAIQAGKTIREEKERAVETLTKVLKGSKRFAGQVESFSREERDGFMWGEILFKGSGEFSGERFKIWYKNENLVAWKNNQLDITCPDAIIILDARTGNGLYNWGDHFFPGREVAVLGIPAAPIWNCAQGWETFGPSHFGFDFSPKQIQADDH